MIKSTAKAHSNGQMVENTLDNGARVNNMDKEHTLKKVNKEKASGIWVKE